MTMLKKILYGEDEADIREIAKIALEDIGGFELMICKNGKEVLTNAKNYEAQLILLDVMMPDMDGLTALKELRNIPFYKDIPAIFMTAKIQKNEIAEYSAMGVITTIAKPFDPVTLAEKIKAIWEETHAK